MNRTEELTQAFIEHEAHSGNKPSRLRIHNKLWQELKQELEESGVLRANVDAAKEEPLQFKGASVTLVSDAEDPNWFFLWSII